MKLIRIVVASGCLALGASVGCSVTVDEAPTELGENNVIYGTDDREDPATYADPTWAARAQEFSVALVATSAIDASNPNDIRIRGTTLSERLDVCSDERFASQPAYADCSGTLIDDDIVLTAGHCINNCADSRFIFNYSMTSSGTLNTLTSHDVYRCVEFLAYAQSRTGLDYAVVRLDRPAVGRQPAAVRTATAPLPNGTPLVVTGHPSGLPLKIADDATVRSTATNGEFFVANLDTFRGNSGSGVFDANTGELVGILVRGAQDYVLDGDCYRPNVCGQDECRGEDVIYAFHATQAMCERTTSDLCSSGCGDGTCSSDETPSSCPADCSGVEVLYDDHAPQGSWVTPGIQVRNTGTSSVDLVGSVVRYYFTQEPAGTLSATCWNCSTPPPMSFNTMPGGGCADATHYLEVQLPAVTLAPNATTQQYRLAFHASSWGAFNPSNDYSYRGSEWNWAPNPKMTMYRDGVLVFGEEPCSGNGVAPAE